MTLILDYLAQAIRSAATYNADAQAPPACILWPDYDRRWASAISRLQAVLPELYMLGAYDPARTGPAIWLCCVLAGAALLAQHGGPWHPGSTPHYFP